MTLDLDDDEIGELDDSLLPHIFYTSWHNTAGYKPENWKIFWACELYDDSLSWCCAFVVEILRLPLNSILLSVKMLQVALKCKDLQNSERSTAKN